MIVFGGAKTGVIGSTTDLFSDGATTMAGVASGATPRINQAIASIPTTVFPSPARVPTPRSPSSEKCSKPGTTVAVMRGKNLLGNAYRVSMTLGSSSLYTGDPGTGLRPGTAKTADQVLIFNGTDYDVFYYQRDARLGSGWRKTTDPRASAVMRFTVVGALKKDGRLR